ncbi:MAG: proprotein convertase P-domain-containing protein [Thermoanaerobaculia bacterium]
MKTRNLLLAVLCLTVLAFGAAQLYAAVTESSTNVPLAITDNGSTNSTLNFSVNGTITDANLTVNITHTWDSDIGLTLTSPSVAAQALLANCGGSADNFTDTVIDEDAAAFPCAGIAGAPFTGSFQSPGAGSMDAFDGSLSGGVWTLNVADDSSICTGTLNAWSLTLDGAPPLPVELMSFDVN